jgi:alkylated DNA nucleotide flippase Atl1
VTEQDDEYVEAVLSIVDRVPRGRVTTYGLIAEVLQEMLGRGGPRTVASVMARYGESVTWWRIVRADGTLPTDLADRARPEYLGEGTPLRISGAVDVANAVWLPSDIHS